MQPDFNHFIEKSAPKLLRNKIKALNINSFEELMSTNLETFLKLPGFGKKCINELEQLKLKIQKTGLMDNFNFDPSEALLELESFFDKYLEGEKDPKVRVIFERRIITETITLEELGFYFSITRERVRQIESELRTTLSSILTMNYWGEKELPSHRHLCHLLNVIANQVEYSCIIDQESLLYFLESNFDLDLRKELDLLYLHLSLIDVYIIDLRNHIFIVSKTTSENYNIQYIYNTVYDILVTAIVPISIMDVIIQCKIKIGDKTIPNGIIESLIQCSPSFIRHGNNVQIATACLDKYGDLAFRVLSEKGSPIHYSEIHKEVNHRRVTANKKPFEDKNNAALLRNDKRFISEGRSGFWGLQEWGAGKTVKERILEFIISCNRPVTKEELFESIKLPDQYKDNAIAQILSMSLGKELEYDKNKNIILASWTPIYGKAKKAIKAYDREMFIERVKNILKKQSLSAKAIWEADDDLKKVKIETFTQRLNNAQELEKTKHGSTTLYTWTGYTKPIQKTKFEQVEILVTEYLVSKNGSCKLEDIKKYLINLYYQKPLIYKVISESKLFTSVKDKGRSKIVHLNNQETDQLNSSTSESEEEIEISELLKKEESKTLEFKSSLRWDVNESCINSELEWSVLKTICAFLNSSGGILLIGVSDEKEILGLDSDFASFKSKQNIDGFVLHLTNLLNKHFSKVIVTENIKIVPYPVFGRTICKVIVSSSTEAITITPKNLKIKIKDECFYVRNSNSTERLTAITDITKYCKTHFKE